MFKRLAAAVCGAALLALVPMTSVKAEVFHGYDSADFVGQPSVVTKLGSEDALASLEAEQSPNVIWMEVDSSLQAVAESGEALGAFADIYEDEVSGVALPVVQPQDADALSALAEYAAASPIEDLAIASADVTLLMQAQESLPSARLYYIASAAENDSQRQAQLGLANTVGAQVIVMDGEDVSAEAVSFYQARFKSVWVDTDGSAEQIADAVGSGAYGVISPDAQPVYGLYERIAATSEEAGEMPDLLSRSPFIAAHRGYVAAHAENTVGAIEDAAAMGATHAEIDIYLTADNEIVLHHNATVTYDGRSVSIGSLTLAQLQTIDLGSPSDDVIPTIDEVFQAMNAGTSEGMDEIILIVEFKGREAELVTLFAQKVYQYNMASRISVISFFPEQIQRVRAELPTISTSYLLYTTGAENALAQAKAAGSGIDMQVDTLSAYYGSGTLASAYSDYFRTLADRGYSVWLWTYDDNVPDDNREDDKVTALRNGVTGITTNDAYMGSQIRSLSVPEVLELQQLPADGDMIEISALTYGGDEVTVPARVILLSQGEKEAQVMLAAQPETGMGLLSGCVTVQIAEGGGPSQPSLPDPEQPEEGGGCSSAAAGIGAGSGALLLLASAAAVMAFRRKN